MNSGGIPFSPSGIQGMQMQRSPDSDEAESRPLTSRSSCATDRAESSEPSVTELTSKARCLCAWTCAMMLAVALASPYATCAAGFPWWVYAIIGASCCHSIWESIGLTRWMTANDEWRKRCEELKGQWNPFNYWLLIFLWGPLDKIDSLTDVMSVVQQYHCRSAVQPVWERMWQKSRFDWLGPVIESFPFWALQLVILLVAVASQLWVVFTAQTRPTQIRVRLGWLINEVKFDYSDVTPSTMLVGMDGGAWADDDNSFKFDRDEYLTAIEVDQIRDDMFCFSDQLLSIIFETSKGRRKAFIAEKEQSGEYKSEAQPQFWGQDVPRFRVEAPTGMQITNIRRPELQPGKVDCPTIDGVYLAPKPAGSSSGTSEAAALDLASMFGPATLLCCEESQRWGRAFQVAFSRVLLESALQTSLQSSALQMQAALHPDSQDAVKQQTFSVVIAVLSALPKVVELLRLSQEFRPALFLAVFLILALGFSTAKVITAWTCESHLWNLTSGCVEVGAVG